jgi:aminoglycoside phosphotransferase (APT) family kinase protein
VMVVAKRPAARLPRESLNQGLRVAPPGPRSPGQCALQFVNMEITTSLVRALIKEQFPRWKLLAVEPAQRQGNDNWTFRLGDALSVRLPRSEAHAAGITREHQALKSLSTKVSLALPEVLASGEPSDRFPAPWSVRRWLPGEALDVAPAVNRERMAEQLGGFLTEMRRAPTTDGPPCGRHSFFRGCHPSVYADEVQDALAVLGDSVDRRVCEAIWAEALCSAWPGQPVWFHGDLAAGNILVDHEQVSAIIDLGTCGVGDPACDLVIAWTFMDTERERFREAAQLDAETWARAAGWALWKALITLADTGSSQLEIQHRALKCLIEDRSRGTR